MTIALISDYFPDINKSGDYSGAEVSIKILYEALIKTGETVVLVNLGEISAPKQKIARALSVNNPIWITKSIFFVWHSLRNKNIDVIHVQGKNSMVGGFVSKFIFRKPLVITVRDYRVLCDLGTCLLRGNQVCTIQEYFLKDIPEYIKKYTRGNVKNYIYSYLTGCYHVILRPIYGHILKSADRVVCISDAQRAIFRQAGIINTTTIYNMAKIQPISSKRNKLVIFVGRYSIGKGKELLDLLIPKFLEKFPDWKFQIVSSDRPSFPSLRLKVTQKVSHKKLLNLFAKSALTITPSIWPEPFGRVALDSISVGTPVISTDRGGLPEIVSNGKYGYISSPEEKAIWTNLEKGIRNRSRLTEEIIKSKRILTDKFYTTPLNLHLKLYQKIT